MSLTAQLFTKLTATQTRTLPLSTPTDALAVNLNLAPTGDQMYHTRQTLEAEGAVLIDLSNLSNGVGESFAFQAIRLAAVINRAPDGYVGASGDLERRVQVGGAASDAFIGWFGDASDVEEIGPGGQVFHYDPYGWTVAAGQNVLRIANLDAENEVTVDLVLIGDQTE